jgi:protein-S-isoprenylcysteine O-methyltransferase Ste14
MPKRGRLEGLRIVRSAIREDLLYFALPAIIVFYLELRFCRRDGFSGFWGTLWELIKHPQDLFTFPVQSVIGLALIVIGFIFLLAGQITLGVNHSSTVAIRENHRLVTNGIYHFTRNPMYLGVIMIFIGIPVYAASLYGFLTALLMIPLFLVRIRLEERLLTEAFHDAYQQYKKSTKKLIPFIY